MIKPQGKLVYFSQEVCTELVIDAVFDFVHDRVGHFRAALLSYSCLYKAYLLAP